MQIPQDCVLECSGSGDRYEYVALWVEELNFSVPSDQARAYLKEFGAWEDLDDCLDELLAQRVLWIACCEIKEQGEWFGLIH